MDSILTRESIAGLRARVQPAPRERGVHTPDGVATATDGVAVQTDTYVSARARAHTSHTTHECYTLSRLVLINGHYGGPSS